MKFHQTFLSESTSETSEETLDPIPTGTGLLERLIQAVRDSLGTDTSPSGSCKSSGLASEDQWSSNASVVDDFCDRTGFLRMVSYHY